MTRSQSYRFVAIISVLLMAASASLATELAPGRIFNPGGIQMFMSAAYNPVRDEYLLTSAGVSGGNTPQALVLHLSPDGTIPSGVTVVSPDIAVNETDIAYNPDRNEYLIVWRYDQPIDVMGLYLDGDGNAIGSPIAVAATGDHETAPLIEYSTSSKDYMVVWQEKPVGASWTRIQYRMIDGDSTSGVPLVGAQFTIESDVWSPAVAYGSVSDKFLVVFTKETAAKDEIYGRFVAGDGSGFLSGVIPIVSGNGNQNSANIAYASSNDRWLVTLSDWSRATANAADALAVLINNAGGTVASGYIAATPREPISGGWDSAGPITYNSASDRFFATWRIEPYAYGREVSPEDASMGDRIFLSDENAGPTAAASRNLPSGPQYLAMWRNSHGLDGVHAGIIEAVPTTEALLDMETPADGLKTLLPLNVSGWAIDTAASSGSGIDLVEITATLTGGGAPQVLGQDTSFTSRSDVAATYGAQFENSGFSLDVTALADGEYDICAKGRSTVTGTFDAEECATVLVGPDPRMNVESPASGATVGPLFDLWGWAVDLAANSGTGVDLVRVTADPVGPGADIPLGNATYGVSRPDVGAFFGNSQYDNSGFSITIYGPLEPGDYTLRVEARSTVTGTFNNVFSVDVTVEANTLVNLDSPSDGSTVAAPFVLWGWAFNTGSTSGAGVDSIEIWVIPDLDPGNPVFLGNPTIGVDRQDVADAFGGSSNYVPSGFGLTIWRIDPGDYTLQIKVHTTVTGDFDATWESAITVTSERMFVDSPAHLETVSSTFTLSGWAVDLAAPSGPGVDAINVSAFPLNGDPAFFVGSATEMGLPRPDVGAYFGNSQFDDSGFSMEVTLAPGDYVLAVYARSTVTGNFTNLFERFMTVSP